MERIRRREDKDAKGDAYSVIIHAMRFGPKPNLFKTEKKYFHLT